MTGRAGRFGALDPIAIPDKPLDVLCQHLAGLGIGQLVDRDAALAMFRRAYPYRDLSAEEFDDCLRYLAGRKADGSDWLPPRLAIQGSGFSIVSRSVGHLLRRNLGTIVAEEPRPVRLEGADRLIGELDEAFAERLNAGDRFLLDGRCLTLRKHGDRDLLVEESAGFPWVPRWGSKGPRIGETLARHLFEMRRTAAIVLRDGPEAWAEFCRTDLRLGPAAAEELGDFLDAQESASEVPEPGFTLIEAVDRGHGVEYAVHTPLHSAGNEALAAVLQQRLVDGFGGKVTAAAFTLGVLLFHEIDVPLGEAAWRRLLDPADFAREIEAHRLGSRTSATHSPRWPTSGSWCSGNRSAAGARSAAEIGCGADSSISFTPSIPTSCCSAKLAAMRERACATAMRPCDSSKPRDVDIFECALCLSRRRSPRRGWNPATNRFICIFRRRRERKHALSGRRGLALDPVSPGRASADEDGRDRGSASRLQPGATTVRRRGAAGFDRDATGAAAASVCRPRDTRVDRGRRPVRVAARDGFDHAFSGRCRRMSAATGQHRSRQPRPRLGATSPRSCR